MADSETEQLFRNALETWGVESQIHMFIEEIMEWNTALYYLTQHKDDFVSEAVDVYIMTEQMKLVFVNDDETKRKYYDTERETAVVFIDPMITFDAVETLMKYFRDRSDTMDLARCLAKLSALNMYIKNNTPTDEWESEWNRKITRLQDKVNGVEA